MNERLFFSRKTGPHHHYNWIKRDFFQWVHTTSVGLYTFRGHSSGVTNPSICNQNIFCIWLYDTLHMMFWNLANRQHVLLTETVTSYTMSGLLYSKCCWDGQNIATLTVKPCVSWSLWIEASIYKQELLILDLILNAPKGSVEIPDMPIDPTTFSIGREIEKKIVIKNSFKSNWGFVCVCVCDFLQYSLFRP